MLSLATPALLSAVQGVSTFSEMGSVPTEPDLNPAPVIVLFALSVMFVSSNISNGSTSSERLEASLSLLELEIGYVQNLLSFAASIFMSVSQAALPFIVTEFLFATPISETISTTVFIVFLVISISSNVSFESNSSDRVEVFLSSCELKLECVLYFVSPAASNFESPSQGASFVRVMEASFAILHSDFVITSTLALSSLKLPVSLFEVLFPAEGQILYLKLSFLH